MDIKSEENLKKYERALKKIIITTADEMTYNICLGALGAFPEEFVDNTEED